MKLQHYSLILTFILISLSLGAQNKILKGVVKDSKNSSALAFVNIITNNGYGATTNIDGKFSIFINSSSKSLIITYIGYESLIFNIEDIRDGHVFYMTPKIIKLNEVEVFPGENPAHRIIDSVLKNRDINNPEKIEKFSYVSYDKMNIFIETDSLPQDDSMIIDTTEIKFRKFVEKQDIFLLETVTERKYMAPDLNQETVLATRVSGFKDPIIAFMISQIQSTSFYDPQINIFGQKYANPISRGSKNKYFFLIEDTTYSDRGDTVFMISFRPMKDTKFEGMKGFLYVNSHKWAIQNVKASPPDDSTGIVIQIQQAYKLIDNQWFPHQLDTHVKFMNMMVSSGENSYPMAGKGRSYIQDIDLNPDIKKKDFGFYQVEIEEGASKQKGEFWRKYRVDSLSDRERETYRIIDSIGNEAGFDQKATYIQTMLVGKFPLWIFDIDLDKLFHYNNYEGFYVGFGLHTNDRFSKRVKLGGYWGYGFNDESSKYGLDISLKVHKPSESVLHLDIYNKVTTTGGVEFYNDKFQAWRPDNFYKFFIKRMNVTKGGELSYAFRLRTLRDFKWNVGIRFNEKTAFDNYYFTSSEIDDASGINQFTFTEFNIGFRFAFREKLIETTRGQLSLGSKYPVIQFNYTRGIKGLMGGDFNYDRFDLKVQKKHETNYFGDFTWRLMGGYIIGQIPASNLFDGNGTYRPFTLFAPYSFATMRTNEFMSNIYAALFLTHDFGELLFKFGSFKPQLLLLTNIAFGNLNHAENHHNYDFKTLNKGYYESGFMVRKILNLNFIDLGLGIMYRYGPYSFDDQYLNFAYKVSLFYGF